MNLKPIFNLFSPKGKAQTVVQQGVTILLISVVVLSLMVLTGYGRIVQASGPAEQVAASSFHQWRTSQVVTAFESAGLEVEAVRTGKKYEDDGLSMFMAVEATRFRIPSAGETEGGIILSFYKADDLARMRNYYLALNESLPQFSSWVFVEDNILLQINQSLPGSKARQYAAALEAMKTDKILMVTARP